MGSARPQKTLFPRREEERRPATAQAVRVLVADPDTVIHEGLRTVLRKAPDLRLQATARTGSEAVRLAQLLQPQVALTEGRFHQQPSGVRLVQELLRACPQLNVVVFSDASSQSAATRLLAAGARGFLCKDVPAELVVHALRTAASGGSFVWLTSGAALFEGLRCLGRSGPLDSPVPQLTPRERQYLQLIVEGLTDAQIAHSLRLATPTVKAQLRRLYVKLGARNRAQAVARALVLGLLK